VDCVCCCGVDYGEVGVAVGVDRVFVGVEVV